MTDNRDAWAAFRAAHGPRPGGRAAQALWEGLWEHFQRTHTVPWPPFSHAPAPHRHSMIAYDIGGTNPLEYNIGHDWPDSDAIRAAKNEAFVAIRKRVVVRNPDGQIIYDGPSHRMYSDD